MRKRSNNPTRRNARTSVLAIATGFALCVCGAASANAQDFKYTPVNPNFGGDPFNGSNLLAIANAQNDYKDPALSSNSSSQSELFVRQLQSRLLSSLASQVSDAIFGENPQDSGTIVFGDQVISFQRGLESVQLTITDNLAGTSTDIEIPLLVASTGGESALTAATGLSSLGGNQVMNAFKKILLASALAAASAGCASTAGTLDNLTVQPAQGETATATQEGLKTLPSPKERISVAVYNFMDQTGQFEPSDGVQSLSRAVTQGATSILVKALQDAGNRSWFTVVERENLDNLLRERQIIREMRRQYLGEEIINPEALPPMLFAGIILEGGVIGYDTNTMTGGAGARFLGIGGHTNYREDNVTVYLRAVSVKTGEVITTVVASKKIASISLASNVFRYVSFKELLEAEAGVTSNEPEFLALRQAIEKAVEQLVLEGADLGVWNFADQVAGAERLQKYRARKSGVYPNAATATDVASEEMPDSIAAIERARATNGGAGRTEG